MILTEASLLSLARIQATLWTGIDALCVALVLLSLDRIRAREGRPPARVRWTLLFISLLAFPRILSAGDKVEFFYREVLVVSLHLGALLACVVDIPVLARLLRDLENRSS